MADKRATPEAEQEKREDAREDAHKGPRRKKRAPPTIDLTATEVKPVPPDPPPHTAESEPPESHAEAAAGGGERGAAPAPGIARPVLAGGLIGGLAGAAIAALLLIALWLTGLAPVRDAGTAASPHRIAALEKQLHDLQSRPAAAADTKALDVLRQRLNKLENDIASLPPGDKSVAERLASADNAMKSLGVALAALNKRGDDIAANAAKARDSADAAAKAVGELRVTVEAMKNAAAGITPAELDALQKRLAALEQSAKTARDDIAKASTSDNAARLALAAAALRDAVESGAPFTAELNAVKSLGGADKALAMLAPFAGAGVPSDKALAHELGGLIPAMVKAANAQAPTGGFLERLQANAGKLVRISPVDAPPGDDPSAVLARIEVDTARTDIPAALADLNKLAEKARAPAKDWIEKANKRQAAFTAARQVALAAVRALGARTGAQ
jgi:hypothetical protein